MIEVGEGRDENVAELICFGLIFFEISLGILHEILINLVVLCLFIKDGLHRCVIKTVNDRPRTSQKNRRMCGNDELCVSQSAHLLKEFQKLQLALG